MKIHHYINEKNSIILYKKLLNDIYNDYSEYTMSKITEFRKNIDIKNPANAYVSFRNFILIENSKPVAHASAIIDDRLPKKVGLIGNFECVNNKDYAKKIFDEICKFFKENGKSFIRGPVNFSTWQTFRISYPSNNPPFFTEPYTPDYYKDFFEEFGFNVAQYNLTKTQNMTTIKNELHKDKYTAVLDKGFSFCIVNKNTFNKTLRDVYEITKNSFCDTWSFVPISYEEFKYQYRDMGKLIDKSIVVVVYNSMSKSVAFSFSVPNLFCKDKKELVIKTIGVLPEFQKESIGKALLYFTEMTALQLGFEKSYYSTMRSDNMKIQSVTKESQNIYREYAVYEINI